MGFFRDSVLPRLTVESAFLSRAKLKRRGSQWRGPCPIHGGRSDNLVVSDQTLAWYCHSKCQVGGGPIEFIAACEGGADAIPVSSDRVRQIIRELAHVAGVASTDDVRESIIVSVEPEPIVRPPRANVFALWRSGARPTNWPACVVESWGVDPAAVVHELRGLVAPAPYRWARSVGRQWGAGCYEIIIPLRDPQMRPVSYVARSAEAAPGLPKSGSPTGVSGKGLIMANAEARDIIRDQMPGGVIVVREGERDWLLESQREACIGIRSGSWTDELADALPPHTHVVVATDNDAAGHVYADRLTRSLERRDDITTERDIARQEAA